MKGTTNGFDWRITRKKNLESHLDSNERSYEIMVTHCTRNNWGHRDGLTWKNGVYEGNHTSHTETSQKAMAFYYINHIIPLYFKEK